MNETDEIVRLLRSRGLKVTPQRIAILRLLKNGGHFNIEQVLNELRKIEPNISISTVYNALNTFVELGILRSFEVDGKTWYEIRKKPHINVVCEDTGQIIDVNVDVSTIERKIRSMGIMIRDLTIVVRGNCISPSLSGGNSQK
ncbi:ferric uptake regulator, Fur family [Vulcanisaeta moutnovskia 768-28]|uniref:Ferric uptake regulator, Fur family n=1 Tax=Vulcanisaeta moutnovskia (strain 768-28) TaxID=985053 RepID=F0QVK5_VULM7|nr:Fur family transcriptional regulator [Vulcanisaeta moutnovskia]ADY00858.1 ferric uptake regulator, Fur family [Vulcanisaeta moutnovskia 768-28]